jgi:hypothetical protein
VRVSSKAAKVTGSTPPLRGKPRGSEACYADAFCTPNRVYGRIRRVDVLWLKSLICLKFRQRIIHNVSRTPPKLCEGTRNFCEARDCRHSEYSSSWLDHGEQESGGSFLCSFDLGIRRILIILLAHSIIRLCSQYSTLDSLSCRPA